MHLILRNAALGVALALCTVAATAVAQPFPLPAPGTPPKPLRELPAPPAVAEQWNGVWNLTGGLVFDEAHAVQAVDPANGAGFAYGPLPGARFTGAPYKPEYQKIYDDTVKQALKGIVTDPMANCVVPHGMPRIMGGGPGPVEVIVRPNQVWMLFDYMNESRRIYTDGRGHAKREEAFPLTMAHSIGRWEGDTLVVDSVDMPNGIFDRTGAPHSDQVHLMERIRLIDADTLEVAMTIEDPVVFTGPWKVTRRYRRLPLGSSVVGSYCDNNRNDLVGPNGEQSAVLATDVKPAKASKTGRKK